MVAAALPAEAEALGLLALLLYSEARRPAQFDGQGRFVGLGAQDTALWRHDFIAEAEDTLWRASRLQAPGAMQLEAAIQSAHCQRATTGSTPWPQIAALYAALVARHGSIGALIGQAVALAESGDAAAGLQLLGTLPEDAVRDHQAYWVALAHLQRLSGQPAEAALQRALGLTADERVRAFLRRPVRLHSGAE